MGKEKKSSNWQDYIKGNVFQKETIKPTESWEQRTKDINFQNGAVYIIVGLITSDEINIATAKDLLYGFRSPRTFDRTLRP